EAEDERKEVDRERRNPEERHGRDVLRDVVRHRKEEKRHGSRERAPEGLTGDGRRRLDIALPRVRLDGLWGWLRCSDVLKARPARGGTEADKEYVTGRPGPGLR